MKLIVRPRWKLKDVDPDTPYIVISISDPPPFGEPAKIPRRWGWQGELHLAFADVKDAEHSMAMKPEHGAQIIDFVRQHLGQIDTIVVHCEAGASRSPSIAFALCDAFGWPNYCVDWAHPLEYVAGVPNAHVYETVAIAAAESTRRITRG